MVLVGERGMIDLGGGRAGRQADKQWQARGKGVGTRAKERQVGMQREGESNKSVQWSAASDVSYHCLSVVRRAH